MRTLPKGNLLQNCSQVHPHLFSEGAQAHGASGARSSQNLWQALQFFVLPYLARCTQILLRKLLSFVIAAHTIVFGEVTQCAFSVSWEPLCICPRLIFKVTVAAYGFVRLNCPLIAVAVWAWGSFCFLSYNLLLPCFGTQWLQIGQPFSLNCVLFDVSQAVWASWLWHRKPLAVLCISFLHAGISHFSLNPGFH